ncbi:MAG: hypothetical protein K9N06_11435 [Candidatus Cloacimonetes bacterium]|nr:hypothetical protein [Candidatus Cloacimonadota bacterium]
MKKILLIGFILLCLSSIQAAWISTNAGTQELFSCEYSNRSVTELEFTLDGYELENIEKDGVTYTMITHPDQGYILEIGKPELPVFTTLVAISGQGTPQLSYSTGNYEIIQNIMPFPQQELQLESEPYVESFTINEDFYRSAGNFPAESVVLGEPAIMRDLRLVLVTVQPFRYNPATQELEITSSISIEINVDSAPGINELSQRGQISKHFEPFYKGHVINYELTETREDFQQPCILFVYPNNTQVSTNLAYLTEWKHERGFEVHTASTSQTGTSSTAIKNYIQNAYNTWDNPPEYVVLVGDAGGSYNIPTWTETWSWYNGEGDQPYSQLNGTDILADVFVGRMPYGTISELQTLIAKSLNYESTPYMTNPDWLETFTLCGDPSSSGPSTVSTCRYVQEVSQEYNPNFDYNEIFSGSYASQMSTALNGGTLYFCYRGYIGMSGFNTTSITSLNNGWMLPFASILTCGTGGFTGTCNSEVFARAGTATNPKGAIAAVGTATSGTHTCFNNCVTAGMFEGIFNLDIFTPGGALVNGKLNLYENYPQNPSNYVNVFSHWNNLMGDPSVSLYTGLPQQMNVDFPAIVGLGAANLPVTVTDHSGQPLQDAWVTILKGDDDIFATGYTDENGQIWLPLESGETGTVTLTVTAHDCVAIQTEFQIMAVNIQLTPRDFTIDDDNSGSSSGNSNGIINNGETVELSIMVNNTGSQTASGVTASLECQNELVNITSPTVSYPSILPGQELPPLTDFVIEIDPSMPGSSEITLEMTINCGIESFLDIIVIPVQAPFLSFSDYTLIGVNNIIDPGETGELSVELDNLGEVASGGLTALLQSDDDFVEINDADGSFNNINPGSTGENTANTFEITVNSMAIPGTMIPFSLLISNADGFSQVIYFSIDIGTVAVTDPLGPDAYGYLCYDDQDSQYLECPDYNWIEINPGAGGSGTQLNINTVYGDDCDITNVNFPAGFNFNFYGEHYTMFTVGTAGWIAPGGTQIRSFMNWHVPGAHGPSPMIAAFWDDLHNGTGHVYTYYDEDMHYYIIEWYHFQNEVGNAEETFQIILYDANFYPTSTMDSRIKIQYQEFNNVNSGTYRADHGQFCTVGLEDETGMIGLEYTYNNTYPAAARVITDGTALLFTTMPIPPDGPYLTLGAMVLNDENGNGTADYGEDIDIDLMISNIGSELAQNVNVSISSNDEYITLGNASSAYPDILNGDMATNLIPFEITVDSVVPDGHLTPIILHLTCDGGTWDLITEIELNAPSLGFLDYMVNDGVDNILDPGETSDILINFNNSGGAPIYNAEITLTTNDSYLTINNDFVAFGNIPGEEIATGIFNFTAAVNSPQGHEAIINWSLNAGQNYSSSGSFGFVISQVPVLIDEDFSGNFPPDGWYIAGQNWSGSSTNNAGGAAPEAKFNWSPSVTGDQRLVCGPFSTSGSSELDLSFRQYVNHFSGTYSLKLETSSNGTSWHESANWPPQSQNATVSTVDITTVDVGSSTFYMAFTFSGNSYNINYWYIDNVHLEGVSMEPLGYIQGLVSIGGTGNVTDVEINVGGQTVHPNIYGNYSVILTPGTYTLTASLEGYDDFVVNGVVVIETQITQQDIVLGFIPTPENLTAVAQEDGVLLNWELSQEDRRRETRELEYYNIYFSFNNGDFELAGNATEMNYLHQPYLPGMYAYYVKAYYTESGETLPSNTATAWFTGTVNFGDINESFAVDSYDAALVMQYFVGFDPLPQLDPIPWEAFRLYLGDVDANGAVEAYDASLILQYTVGVITSFPCEPDNVITRIPFSGSNDANSRKR